MKKSKLIVVLGMHRSGTSVITRGLQVLGVNLGSRLLPPKGDNQKGFWEDSDINAINIEMLNAMGSDWHHLAAIETEDVEVLRRQGYFLRAVKMLHEKVADAPTFAFKDPRVAKLMPFWQEVFSHCQFDVSTVVALRHPLSVARSLAARNGFDAEKSYLLWLGHVITSLPHCVGNKRVLVDYDRLMQSPDDELTRVAKCIDLKIDPSELQSYKTEFLDQGLRHTVYDLNDLLSDEQCPPIVCEIYTALLDVASDKARLEDVALQNNIMRWSEEYERLRSPLLLVDRLFIQKSERDGHLSVLNQTLAERDEQINILNQAVAAREGQILSLNQALAGRDEQINILNQAVAAREGQISSLNQAVLERDGRIAGLNRAIPEIRAGRSSRLGALLQSIAHQVYRVDAATRFGITIMQASGGPGALIKKVYKTLCCEGIRGLRLRVERVFVYYRATGQSPYMAREMPSKETPIQQIDEVTDGPLISVLLPVYNPPIAMLEAAINSVCKQTYKNWELCIVDDRSSNLGVIELLKRYAILDSRIKIRFREQNGHISAALNTALDLCKGGFVTVLDHDDMLDLSALNWVAKTIKENPLVDYIYSDEDKVSKDGLLFFGPFFKPDWSPEYFLSMMYTCHLGVYRTKLVRDIGGYRSDFDGAQDYDLALRVLMQTEKIIHIPQVLYHWRVWENSTAHSIQAKPYAENRARKALEEYLCAKEERFLIAEGPRPGHHRVVFMPNEKSLISIVIPTANGHIEIDGELENHLNAVISSIISKSTYQNYEILIVHNGNLGDEQVSTLRKFENIQLIHYEAETFSLSEKINLGCSSARGEYLVIMNDDIRVISENWLEMMLGMVQREGVGVVGPKLLFPDGTIQHAGVVLLGGLPGHAYYQWPQEAEGYALGAQVDRNYIAVTGACAMTPKWLFEDVGGYSPRYPLNYNDIDYCLKVYEKGYRSVCLAGVILTHYEGVSKEGGRSVSTSEIQKFSADWGMKYPYDPYYNPNLNQRIPYQF